MPHVPAAPVLLLAALPMLLGAAPVGAPTRIQTGAAAYGDWRGDAPGVTRLIRPADMPPPFATRSDANGPTLIRRPPGALPAAPPGFVVSLWAEGLDQPRVIRRAPDGDIFVAESGAGRVLVFHPGADGRVAARAVFAGGLDLPFGIAFRPGFVYVAETTRVVRYPWHPPALTPSGAPETVIPHLPTGGHWTRDLAFSPDYSRLFVSIGSDSNDAAGMSAHAPGGDAAWDAAHGRGAAWGDEAGRAAVVSVDPDGHDARVVATGLRNCAGLAVQPATGALWCATNERDGLGDDLPPDYATRVTAGQFFGWPWFYIGDHPDPRQDGRRADLARDVALPDVLIQPHSAPLGITFADAATAPPVERGDAFVALHGSWNRGQRTGYKVVRLPMQDGRPTGAYQDFLTGFVTDRGQVWGRPVDVATTTDGALLVTEDGNGTIWRIAPQPGRP